MKSIVVMFDKTASKKKNITVSLRISTRNNSTSRHYFSTPFDAVPVVIPDCESGAIDSKNRASTVVRMVVGVCRMRRRLQDCFWL